MDVFSNVFDNVIISDQHVNSDIVKLFDERRLLRSKSDKYSKQDF